MTEIPNKVAGRPYSAKVEFKAQSSTTCSFCWFVLMSYPSLTGMTERDHETYNAHLQKSHGLQGEIEP